MRRFERRLKQRWCKALDLLEWLALSCMQSGSRFDEQHRVEATAQNDSVLEALTRLHAHSCQIASEILVFLHTGHANGAMARWRSLHEVAVVAMFLADNGQETARRYLLHDRVKSHEDAKAYQKHCGKLGYIAFSDEEMLTIETEYSLVLEEFGDDYQGGYGWAARALRTADPPHKGGIYFSTLEEAVGLHHFEPFYRMASHTIHPSAKCISFNLGVIYPFNALPAGRSNAGLADPGQCCAISLVQATTTLLTYRSNIEVCSDAVTLLAAARECCAEFAAAQSALESDEQAHRHDPAAQ